MKFAVYKYDGKLWTGEKLADFLDLTINQVRYATYNKPSMLRGRELVLVGYAAPMKIYELVENDQVVFEGTLDELVKKTFYLEHSIREAMRQNKMLGKRYRVRKTDRTKTVLEGEEIEL